MKRFKIVYIDDVKQDLDRYGNLMAAEDTAVVGIRPPLDLDVTAVTTVKPDAVIIDYELTTPEMGTRPATYRGGTLATRLREVIPDVPLILLTRKSLLRRYEGAIGQLGSVDFSLFKDDLDQDAGRASSAITAFIRGYSALHSAESRDWNGLVSLLGADDSETEQLADSNPPLKPSVKDPKRLEWAVPDASKWITRILFKFPGVLYNELHAATTLGISTASFETTEIQAFFKAAAYIGPFADLEPRWWKLRLERLAYEIVSKSKMKPPLSESFAPSFEETNKGRLFPSICVYSGEKHADTVCYILNAPVKRKYTLDYFPLDDRPAAMEHARVSFKAIRESPTVQDELFSPEGKMLLPSVRELPS